MAKYMRLFKISFFCWCLIGLVFFLPQTAKATAERLPDLRILGVTFGARDSDGQRTADVVVMNAGSASAGAFDMYTEWLDDNGEVLGGCIENMNSLGVARTVNRTSISMCNRTPDGSDWEDPAVTVQKSNRAVRLRVSVDKSPHPEGDNKIVESNENNNVFIKTIPLPDLQIMTVTFGARDSEGQRTADVLVINAGRSSSGAFDMYTEWLDANGEVLGGCIENMNSMNVGQMVNRTSISMCNRTPDGSGWEDPAVTVQKSNKAVKFRVSIDRSPHPEGNDKIVESNENNNVKTVNVPLPDLRVLGVTFGARNSEGQRTADVVVMNAGSGSSGSFDMYTEWLDANGEVLGGCIENMNSLGVSRTVNRTSITMCNRTPDGNNWEDPAITVQKSNRAVRLRVSVDRSPHPEGDNKIVESNENNNVFIKNLTLPDLQIITVTLARNSQGERIGNVLIINSGKVSTPPRFNILSEWLDGNGRVINSCGSGAGVASLGVGRMITAIARSCPGNLADQAAKLRVTVDSDTEPVAVNLLAESNENNNSKTINIPLPDLKVEGMNFRGTDKHPEVTFINKGAVAANGTTRVAYDWYGITGERLGGCYENISALGRNKRYTQKNVFCGNNDSYKYATKFKATIDVGDGTGDAPESKIFESAENNNSMDSPIPGRVEFVRLHPPEIINIEPALPSVTVPDEVTAVPDISVPATPVVNVPAISDNIITVPTPIVETPVIITPTIPTTPITPTPTPTPAPIVDTGDKYPSITANLSDDGLVTYTVEGVLNYYGTKAGCTGPRYFDPIIVAWGQIDTHPALDSNNHYTTTHKYNVKNSEYEISVSFINSCFQRTTKRFTVHPKF